MKKKKIKFKKFPLILLLAVIALTATLTVYHLKTFAVLNFEGFGWVGNDLVNGVNTGNPTVGMMSAYSGQAGCSGANYAVTLGGSATDSTRDVLGNAWFGIGSKPDVYIGGNGLAGVSCPGDDGNSLGWVSFQSNSPSFCLADCHAVRWHDGDSNPNNGLGGWLDGWAKINSMSPPHNPTDDGWIHFNGANCGSPGNQYCVRMDSEGNMSGYAWNSGGASVSAGNNSGLGWIKFDDMQICIIDFGSSEITISDSVPTLTLHKKNASTTNTPITLTVTNNLARFKFSSNGNTCYTDGSRYCGFFPAGTTTFGVPIIITPFSGDICEDNAAARVTSACGQSDVTIHIKKTCTVSCSPKDVSIMPGEEQAFAADSPEYFGCTFHWDPPSDPDGCVESTTVSPDTKSFTVKSKTYSSSGNLCALKAIGISVHNCCSSDSCALNVSRPGWIETNPSN